MILRNLATPLLAFVASSLVAACTGSVDADRTGGQAGHGGETGQGGGGGHGGMGAGGAGGEVAPVVCESRPMEHAEACPTEPCAIAEDIEIACDDWEFTAPGLRVAPAPDATWLATASNRASLIHRIAGGTATRVEEGLPAGYARRSLTLALGKDGAPHLASDSTTFDGNSSPSDYPGGAEHAVLDGTSWSSSIVYDRDKGVPVVDLEIGADGAPRVWVMVWVDDDAPSSVLLATLATDGVWDTAHVDTPAGGGGWRRFTLASDDRPVALDFAESGPGWQLRSRIDGVEAALGDAIASSFPEGYAVTHAVAPAGAVAAGPSIAVALQEDDGLHVAWPAAGAYDELVLPNSHIPVPVCVTYWNSGCPASCHETSSGVERDAYAIARTTDGAVWVAFVRTQLDLELQYEEQCDDLGCYCAATIAEDHTTATLHLFRVDTAITQAQEVLSMPIAPLANTYLFVDLWTPVRTVDLRGFGADLAIGVRTRADVELEAAIRVLRVDTTKLPL